MVLQARRVSVPLRGIGYETVYAKYCKERSEITKFPSPCGELVMKRQIGLVGLGFVLSLVFPSPCGELVMKQPPNQLLCVRWVSLGFRPLAGNWL